jgi:hypothetical protein
VADVELEPDVRAPEVRFPLGSVHEPQPLGREAEPLGEPEPQYGASDDEAPMVSFEPVPVGSRPLARREEWPEPYEHDSATSSAAVHTRTSSGASRP